MCFQVLKNRNKDKNKNKIDIYVLLNFVKKLECLENYIFRLFSKYPVFTIFEFAF